MLGRSEAVGTAPAERLRSLKRREPERLLERTPFAEGEGETGGEGVARAIGIHDRRAPHGRLEAPLPAAREEVIAFLAGPGRDDESGSRVEITGLVTLTRVVCAPDKRVEVHAGLCDRLELARGCDEDAGRPGGPQRIGVSAREVHGVHPRERVPGKRIGAPGDQLSTQQRDRPLPRVVEEGESPALRLGPPGDLDLHPQSGELIPGSVTELVAAEGREERRPTGEAGELDGRDGAAARGLGPGLPRVHDLTRARNALHAGELDPLHMPDDRDAHRGSLTRRRARALQPMMKPMRILPFERFYEEHRAEVLAYLARQLGRDAAEDAFQETFLRALRAYGRLEHGRHLRAWVYTIATRVALDTRRRPAASADPPERGTSPSRPAYAELEHLADELPRTERAAVVLRYGYDLSYEDIGSALGSSEDAARQAASSGVRRLRKTGRSE